MTRINVNLPSLVFVKDYHEFRDIRIQASRFIDGLEVEEIGWENGSYVGVAYVNKRPPSQKALQELIDVAGLRHIKA